MNTATQNVFNYVKSKGIILELTGKGHRFGLDNFRGGLCQINDAYIIQLL